MQNISTTYRLTLATLAIIAVVGGVFLAFKKNMISSIKPSATVTSTSTGAVVGVSASNGADVEIVPEAGTSAIIKAPPIHRDMYFTSDIPEDAQAAIRARASKIETELKKSTRNTTAWIDLGTVREMASDHEGARQAWGYVIAVEPGNITALFNRAALYADQLKNYKQAEIDYLKAISLSPKTISAYKSLFDIYSTTAYKPNSGSAENILKQGIQVNPSAFDLQILLARYYKISGRTADAKAEFAVAAENAAKQNQPNVAAQIKIEAGE